MLNGIVVTYTGNVGKIFNDSNIHLLDLNMINGILKKTNFTHTKIVVDAIDEISEFIKLSDEKMATN